MRSSRPTSLNPKMRVAPMLVKGRIKNWSTPKNKLNRPYFWRREQWSNQNGLITSKRRPNSPKISNKPIAAMGPPLTGCFVFRNSKISHLYFTTVNQGKPRKQRINQGSRQPRKQRIIRVSTSELKLLMPRLTKEAEEKTRKQRIIGACTSKL